MTKFHDKRFLVLEPIIVMMALVSAVKTVSP